MPGVAVLGGATTTGASIRMTLTTAERSGNPAISLASQGFRCSGPFKLQCHRDGLPALSGRYVVGALFTLTGARGPARCALGPRFIGTAKRRHGVL